jgi:hypothetical protein
VGRGVFFTGAGVFFTVGWIFNDGEHVCYMNIYRIILTTGESFSDSSPSETIVLRFFKIGLNIFDFIDFAFGYPKVSLLFHNMSATFILTASDGSDSSSSDETSFFPFFFGTKDLSASAAFAVMDMSRLARVVLLIV